MHLDILLKKELLQNLRVEVKVLTLCPYCGKEIGSLEVGSTWVDKKNNIALHDKCWEEIKNNNLKNEKKSFWKRLTGK